MTPKNHWLPGEAMSLRFANARLESCGLPAPYDVVLGVEATLRLAAGDGRLVYEESLFPVVELALAIKDWLGTGIDVGRDFSFDSVESDEPGLLWCRVSGQGWRVGAIDQEFPDVTVYSSGVVREMFSAFVRDVDGWLAASVGRTLDSVRSMLG